MKNSNLPIIAAIAGVLAGPAFAESLTTNFLGNQTGDEGYMFDITAEQAVRITGIQIAYEEVSLTDFIEVFTKSGTHVGSESNPADWLPNTAVSLTVPALDTPSPVINLVTPIQLAAGERAAIYVVRDRGEDGFNLSVSTGAVVGTEAASDGNLTIFSGSDITDFFGGFEEAVTPNVTIQYSLDAAPKVSIIGKKRIRTSERQVKIFGLAKDDVGIDKLRVRYKKERASGKKRNASRLLSVNGKDLFRINVDTFKGRNPVRFTATDTAGIKSKTSTVTVIGRR